LVVQACFSAVHLTGAFHTAVSEQADLISMLLNDGLQNLPAEQFTILAAKIEALVASNDRVIVSSDSVNFKPWAGYLTQLKAQSDHLASIAESFRMAGDEEAIDILASAAEEMQSAYYGSENLVGTMHA